MEIKSITVDEYKALSHHEQHLYKLQDYPGFGEAHYSPVMIPLAVAEVVVREAIYEATFNKGKSSGRRIK